MAQIDFYASDFNLNGSGLGFYGGGFGVSVDVGTYQSTTFVTNSAGTAQGAQVNNIKYQNTASGIINSATSGVWLNQIPNYLATLNVRFTHSTPVKIQNAIARIYDRSDVNNAPSGLTAKMAELIHPDTVQNGNGSGDATWYTPAGSSVTVPLASSPGISGLYAGNGTNSIRQDTRHDWYIAISESPDSIGSKTMNAFYVSLEYL